MGRENSDIIVLNKSFYDKRSVMSSLEDFKGVMSCDISEGGGKIKVILRNVEGNVEHVKNEFCNYVLATMKNRGVV